VETHEVRRQCDCQALPEEATARTTCFDLLLQREAQALYLQLAPEQPRSLYYIFRFAQLTRSPGYQLRTQCHD
jgi:hypothetical protein